MEDNGFESGILDSFQSTDEMVGEVLKGQESLKQTFQGLAPAMEELASAIRGNEMGSGNLIQSSIEDAFTGELVPFPIKGSYQPFPASTESSPVRFDLANGETEVPGVGTFTGAGVNTLSQLDADHAFSGSVYVSGPITAKFYDMDEHITGVYTVPGAGFLSFSNTPVAMVEMYSELPVEIGGALSTAIQNPLEANILSLEQTNYGHLPQTEDTPNPVPIIPYGPGVLESFKVDTLDQAVVEYGNPVIASGTYTTQTWVIENDGANDLDVQVQGFQIPDETVVADTDIHSSTDTSTEWITVAAGDNVMLESSLQLAFKQVLVKNSSIGSPTQVHVQHNGLVPGVRG